MQKELITTKQGITMMIMFLLGSALVVGGGGDAKQDAWIACIIGTIMFLPFIFLYCRLMKHHPSKNLFDIILSLFGKNIGKIIILLYTWYAFHLGSLVIRNFTEFIHVVSLYETPQYIIAMFMIGTSVIMVKAGIEVMGRWTEFFLPIILLTILINYVFAIKDMDFMNIKPLLYDGYKPIIEGGFLVLSFPFAETILFTIIFSRLKKNSSIKKVYIISILTASVFITLATLRNIFILGADISGMLFFPSFSAVRLIHVGDIIERVEITISVIFLLTGLIKISVCLLSSSIGVAKIFDFDNYRPLVVPIALLMSSLSSIIYKSTNEMMEWIKIYPYYASLFQIFLPIMILIYSEFHHKLKKKNV